MFTSKGKSKADARFNVSKKAYEYLKDNKELITILDELPADLGLDNAINVLQELGQKGYLSLPEYSEPVQLPNETWTIECIIKSHAVVEKGTGISKVAAKKEAALRVICYICGLTKHYFN